MRLADSAQVLTGTTAEDPYGGTGTEVTWTSPTVGDAIPASVQPRSGSEESEDRAQAIGDWWAFLYPDAEVTTANRLRWNGRDFEIHAVMPWRDLRGRDHHIELDLSIIEG